MDVFANVSLEWFKILTWAFALAIGAGWFALSDHSKTREVVKSVLNSLLAAASVFFLANLGVIIYILLHMTDPRWSEGKDPLWRPSDQEFNIPGLGNVLQPINEMQQNVSGVVNDVSMMRNAIFATFDFGWMAIWAIIPIIVLGICAFYVARRVKKIDVKEAKAAAAATQTEVVGLRAEINQLRAALTRANIYVEPPSEGKSRK